MWLPYCIFVAMEEVEFFIREHVSVFGHEFPDLVANFFICGYFLISVEFLVCCIFQEVFIERSLNVFVMFNNGWSQIFIAGGDDEVFVLLDFT